MISVIIAAIDGSGFGKKALAAAIDLAGKYQAQLVIVTVMPDGKIPMELYEYVRTESLYAGEVTELLLNQAKGMAEKAGVSNIELVASEGDPAAAILRAAEKHKADLIVMGGRGLGTIGELLLGSVSQKVMHLATAPCMIVR